ncbi:hypothetical protein [Bradyrhizobium sp. 172]|uniref:hypothetical protein n=1 Tax=Bradyrhizobium sp. 172 TaxID=2782643 RepID=UPI001FFED1A0|nr:hypothetical protein [Bradyrhizobium sp. 172]UPJ97396.1 hypothetical protein IVB07_07640 [Bradyrhizobium sp. 172]
MLPDYGRYYGSVLTHIVDHYGKAVSIEKLAVGVQGFYLLNGKSPLYIKFSRSRKGPWSFNFRRDHQTEYQHLVKNYGDCITALVCGKDGIVALNDVQMRQILDQDFEEQESVSVRRKLNHMYSVKGSNGELSQKVSRDSLMSHLGALVADSSNGTEERMLGETAA